jgi:hypothetical protein
MYHFCNLAKYPDVDDAENVEHVTTMSDEKLKKFAEDFGEIQRLVNAAVGSMVDAGLSDTVQYELATRGC